MAQKSLVVVLVVDVVHNKNMSSEGIVHADVHDSIEVFVVSCRRTHPNELRATNGRAIQIIILYHRFVIFDFTSLLLNRNIGLVL